MVDTSYSDPFPLRLNAWKSRLLKHVDILEDLDTIMNTLIDSPANHQVLAATDGGSTAVAASFGWTLRHKTRDLVTCFGPTDTPTSTPFRAECFGLLSLLCFLHDNLRTLTSHITLDLGSFHQPI